MKIVYIVSVVCLILSTPSFAGEDSVTETNERKKAKLVSRLYQATYGSIKRCEKASLEAALDFKNSLRRFEKKNEYLMKLVTESPYYEKAKTDYLNHYEVDPNHDTKEALTRECEYYHYILESMMDTPEGNKATKKFIETLLK